MKPALRVPIALGVILVGVVFFYRQYHSFAEEKELQIERLNLKREFLERAAAARGLSTDRQKDWNEEVRALLRWYFGEIQSMQNRHPGVKPTVAAAPKDEGAKPESAARKQFADFAASTYQALKDGKYDPVLGGQDGGMHLDLLSIEAAQMPTSSERALKIDFALWGVPRRVEKEESGSRTRRVVVPVSFKDLTISFFGPNDKPAKGKGAGKLPDKENKDKEKAAHDDKFIGSEKGSSPYIALTDPERFAEDFPPGVLFGTWYVEPFPAETTRIELVIAADARGAGAEMTVNYKWDLPPQEGWKLRPGEVFKGEPTSP